MDLVQILKCSETLNNCCSSYVLANILDITRQIFSLIQLIVPIALIAAGTVQFIQLSINPEMKGGFRKVLNKFIAAFIIFMLPVIVDVIVGVIPNSVNVLSCWKSSKEIAEVSRNSEHKYIDDHNIFIDTYNSVKNMKKTGLKLVVDPTSFFKNWDTVDDTETPSNDGPTPVPTPTPSTTPTPTPSTDTTPTPSDNKTSEENPNQKVVDYAMEFKGKGFDYNGKWNGEKPYTKTNCSGFISGVYKHFGVKITAKCHSMVNDEATEKISEKDIRPGDIVVYEKRHCALYIGKGKIIHARTKSMGIAVTNNYKYYKIREILRVKGVK